jgi:hypothetical protein
MTDATTEERDDAESEREMFELLGRLQMDTDPTQEIFIRPNIKEALRRWGAREHPFVGDFLRAVLSNNLMEAVGRADGYNIRTLPAICSYVYNELPSNCHGSPEIVTLWSESLLAELQAKHAAKSSEAHV